MHFEHWLQLRGEAPEDRRILTTTGPHARTKGLVHNLGGYPGEMVSFVSILGTELD
jgi:acetyl-CoA C-acetyltransferase